MPVDLWRSIRTGLCVRSSFCAGGSAADGEDATKAAFGSFAATWPRLEVNDAATLDAATKRLSSELEIRRQRSKVLQDGVDAALKTPGIVVTRWARDKMSRSAWLR
jgi:hypothetical protein